MCRIIVILTEKSEKKDTTDGQDVSLSKSKLISEQ